MQICTEAFDGLPQSRSVSFGIKVCFGLDGSSFSWLRKISTFTHLVILLVTTAINVT